MPERLITKVISMIDEMMTFVERDDEAKAPTRQITGHKDLLSSRDVHIQAMRKSIPELDESVMNAIEIRQMQQAEFVTAVYRKCSRDIKESLQEMKSGRHIRAMPRASRLVILARRPFGFTRECETSVSREVRRCYSS